MAVAVSVCGNCAECTNRNWEVQSSRISGLCGGAPALLSNDLTALGYAVPNLAPDQLDLVSPGTATQAPVLQSLVVGIGTGFNVSPVLEPGGTVICPSMEAGHVSIPSNFVKKLCVLGFDPDQFQTIEALFSGLGIREFCQKLTGRPELQGETTNTGHEL